MTDATTIYRALLVDAKTEASWDEYIRAHSRADDGRDPAASGPQSLEEMDEHIDRGRGLATDGGEAAWRDEATVRRLYHEERMTVREVADEVGCSIGTLHKWMKRNGIERRERVEEAVKATRSQPAMFETDDQGYEQWRGETSGGSYRVRVHRLLAVSEHGLDAVRGKLVHHQNGVKWDNRPENIELVTRSEHMKLHHQRGDYDEAKKNLIPGGPEVSTDV